MKTSRMEAFSDGVLAIIITIMVLEMKSPLESSWSSLADLLPTLLSYILSYMYVAIYWNNHHHLIASSQRVTGKILWANMTWLFFISLIPVATGWMSQFHTEVVPTLVYGLVLFLVSLAYQFLQHAVVVGNPEQAKLKAALGRDLKGRFSVGVYLIALLLAYLSPLLAQLVYLLVAIMWFIPDKRIEDVIKS